MADTASLLPRENLTLSLEQSWRGWGGGEKQKGEKGRMRGGGKGRMERNVCAMTHESKAKRHTHGTFHSCRIENSKQ